MNASPALPLPSSASLPALLVKAAERRCLLALVIGLHLLLAVWLVTAEPVAETAPVAAITVSLLAAPAPARPEASRPLPAKAVPPLRSPQSPAAVPLTPLGIAPANAIAAPTPATASTSASTSAATSSLTPPAASSPTASGEARPASVAAAESRGEAVTQARFDADYLQNPAPVYPPLSRRLREEGKVVLRVAVSAQGLADSVEVKSSAGSERLDQAAMKAVRQWKFVPARRGDVAVQSWVLVPVQFKLEQ